jgi:hypothetical protein
VSCPPIRAYDDARIDEQLSLATRSYLDAEVVCADEGLKLPWLCKLYRGDFGDLRAFVADHVDDERAAWMRAHPTASITWGAYRWEVEP